MALGNTVGCGSGVELGSSAPSGPGTTEPVEVAGRSCVVHAGAVAGALRMQARRGLKRQCTPRDAEIQQQTRPLAVATVAWWDTPWRLVLPLTSACRWTPHPM